jgi:hypothetical protein
MYFLCNTVHRPKILIPLTGLPVSHSFSILSLQVWTIHWNFRMTPNYGTYKSLSMYTALQRVSNSTICICTLACSSTHVTVHNSVFTVSSGFNKFATCARAVALNGRKGSLHTFHCAYISKKTPKMKSQARDLMSLEGDIWEKKIQQ